MLPILLLTRPEPAAQRFVARLDPDLMSHVAAIYAPLIDTVVKETKVDLKGYRGLIFTSANAVHAAKTLGVPKLPAFCVGPETTRAAQSAGWPAQQSGQNADTLVDALVNANPEVPLMHLRGHHTRGNISQRLTQSGLTTQSHVIYEQIARDIPNEVKLELSGGAPVVAPLFSARTAKLFLPEMAGLDPTIAAISPVVADVVTDNADWSVHIATAPDGASMGKLVEKLLRNVLSA